MKIAHAFCVVFLAPNAFQPVHLELLRAVPGSITALLLPVFAAAPANPMAARACHTKRGTLHAGKITLCDVGGGVAAARVARPLHVFAAAGHHHVMAEFFDRVHHNTWWMTGPIVALATSEFMIRARRM